MKSRLQAREIYEREKQKQKQARVLLLLNVHLSQRWRLLKRKDEESLYIFRICPMYRRIVRIKAPRVKLRWVSSCKFLTIVIITIIIIINPRLLCIKHRNWSYTLNENPQACQDPSYTSSSISGGPWIKHHRYIPNCWLCRHHYTYIELSRSHTCCL